MSFVRNRGHSVQRCAGVRPDDAASAREGRGAGDGPLPDAAPGRPGPARDHGRGRYAAARDAGARPAARPPPPPHQGRAPEPDGQLARPFRRARRLAARGLERHDGHRRRRGAVHRARELRVAGRAAVGEPRRPGRVGADARCDRGGRRADRGRGDPEMRWPLLADAERTLGWRAVSNRASPPIGSDPLAIEGVSHDRLRDRRAAAIRRTRSRGRAGRARRRHPGDLAGLPRAGRLGPARPHPADGGGRARRAPSRARWRAARTGLRRPATSSRRRVRWPG